jgi:hypothetical protein
MYILLVQVKKQINKTFILNPNIFYIYNEVLFVFYNIQIMIFAIKFLYSFLKYQIVSNVINIIVEQNIKM